MTLFGTSGIRQVMALELLELAQRCGLAVGSLYGRVVVGGDTRTSSSALKHAFISGLLASGAMAYDGGTMPTPTLAFAARRYEAGAMITASHNPPQYNGIKLFNSDGSGFDGEQRKQIESLICGASLSTLSWDKMESSNTYEGAIEQHIERIRQDFPGGMRLRVVVDPGCGAASLVTPRLLRRLGCEVIALNAHPSGFFPREIEPVAASLKELIKATVDFGADLGIAHDGDADRMMAVDERGKFLSGDTLLAIFAREAGAKKVVTTIDASMAIDDMGFAVTRTKVGDTYVSEELKKGGDFGGEPSGSWVFPGVSLCADGIYAAARIAAIASKQKLSELSYGIPSYPILRGGTSSKGIMMSGIGEKLMTLKPLSVNSIDGIKLFFADGWLLIRPSGTEPKIRITAEARGELRVRQLYEAGLKIIEDSTEKLI